MSALNCLIKLCFEITINTCCLIQCNLIFEYLFYLSLSGAFGNVKFCWLKSDKTKKVAIKAMKKKDIIQSKHVDHIENERKILELMIHPFIVS